MSTFLSRLVEALQRAGLPFMVAGSVASSHHGQPRSTQDFDLIVEVGLEQLDVLLAQLPEDQYYVSREAAREAVLRRSQFNVIDLATGFKADLMVLKPRPFSRAEFERRRQVDMNGELVWVASPEDVILAKLEWAISSRSERQWRDVLGIMQTRELDWGYLERWASELGVQEDLEHLKQEAGLT